MRSRLCAFVDERMVLPISVTNGVRHRLLRGIVRPLEIEDMNTLGECHRERLHFRVPLFFAVTKVAGVVEELFWAGIAIIMRMKN